MAHTGAPDVSNSGFVVVFDCESDSSFASLPGQTQEEKIRYMEFTCICALVVPTRLIFEQASAEAVLQASEERTWWRDDSEDGRNPISSLLDLFDKADAIVGYNCLNFDFPLISKFYKLNKRRDASDRMLRHRSKTVDLFARVRDATGRFLKLDVLLKANSIAQKSGDGLRAIALWEADRRRELQEYCMSDVRLTLELSLLDEVKLGMLPEMALDMKMLGLRGSLAARACEAGRDEFVLL